MITAAPAPPSSAKSRLQVETAQRRHLAQARRRLWDQPAGALVRLGDYRVRITDGPDLPVLREARDSGRLSNVRRLVVEYHGWAGGDQRLGDLLNLLDQAGYRYLVHDFDSETGSLTKPPFKHRPKGDWFCLVHGQ